MIVVEWIEDGSAVEQRLTKRYISACQLMLQRMRS